MSDANVSKFITRVNQLLNWIVTAGHIATNPARGVTKPKSTRERKPFSDDDLCLLFGSHNYQQNKFKYPYQYWVPLIGLLTGARINEICQLRAQDVTHVDGTLCFCITGEAGRTKNRASNRDIPIHSMLVELGLMSFLKSLRQKGELRLFPELADGRDGSGQAASKWFKRYRDSVGVDAGNKTFHSFRHTVATRLSYLRCPDYEISDVLGHKQQGETTGRYRQRMLPSHLAETIEMLRFNIPWPPAYQVQGKACAKSVD